ncbi:hypothetical protein [Pseudaestuariivita sp.]|uniref:hypothetical protein n=1 Tax=Pseudaestuariivita sp. TaxID=2211669 RepID=UPI0040588D87
MRFSILAFIFLAGTCSAQEDGTKWSATNDAASPTWLKTEVESFVTQTCLRAFDMDPGSPRHFELCGFLKLSFHAFLHDSGVRFRETFFRDMSQEAISDYEFLSAEHASIRQRMINLEDENRRLTSELTEAIERIDLTTSPDKLEQIKTERDVANARANAFEQRATEAIREAEFFLNQISALREQLGQLQALLDDAKARDAATRVQIQSLGTELNAALARAASEQKKRSALEKQLGE